MQLIRGIHNIKTADFGCVLTIGNFDGVHLGHQRVISALIEKAKASGLPAVVMVFEPQPREVFTPDTAPARLSRLREKYQQLEKLGVDKLLCVNFNLAFAAQSASYFVEHLLVEKMGVRHLIVGDDFHFGKNRQGNYQTLVDAGQRFGFSVTDTKSFMLSDCRISSTEIRQALEKDALNEAQQMLGRPYSIIGRVFHGDKRGRTLGFPTANIKLKRRVSPVSGVYVVKATTRYGTHYGVANVGSRPTVAGIRQQLEVHLFDFESDLYGQTIEVAFLNKIRNEKKFDSIDELTKQIIEDSKQGRVYLNNLVL
ncbi:bifunctional riboflavin kinase/FAD synthetase [Thalassotalea agarivorans]|uniref:Riboflavin biosynthesis protein n=1 Tax=Thalassotalea agarivorans TaxID=349064 RepID=A0A1H9YRZ9_THASX|nr:bifunctional riboflavin kinase/FAD synthetase [Thalassotalea agarivorans]SES71835.1 riboflavin kinase / FMN adenylyltransferase [Thalassotalea agarivorans]